MGQFPNPDSQFKPGDEWRGNRTGRPKGSTLTARLRELFEQGTIGGKPIKDGKQVADLFVEYTLKQAMNGDTALIKYIWDRLDGKVPDVVNQHGESRIRVVYDDPSIDCPSPEASRGATGDPEGGEAV